MENIKQVIRECALRRMKSHSASQGVMLSDVGSEYSRTVHGNWMGLILISGADIRITFKVHFDVKIVRHIIGNMLGSEPSSVSNSLALDFVKEFCNLTGGYVKQVFEDHSVPVITGISLPIVTKGFDDLFYQPSSKDEINDIWKIEIDGMSLFCTPHINIYDSARLATVAVPSVEENTDDDDDGDIDFL